jgi:hypothetical protein
MSLPASSLYYPEDRVTLKGRKDPKGTVLDTNDESQAVCIKFDGNPRPEWVNKDRLRRLAPHEDVSDG